MAEFCTCGSLKIRNNCTNKRCKHHNPGMELATFKQIEYIRDMLDSLGEEADTKDMTQKEASKLIRELEGRIEVGE